MFKNYVKGTRPRTTKLMGTTTTTKFPIETLLVLSSISWPVTRFYLDIVGFWWNCAKVQNSKNNSCEIRLIQAETCALKYKHGDIKERKNKIFPLLKILTLKEKTFADDQISDISQT